MEKVLLIKLRKCPMKMVEMFQRFIKTKKNIAIQLYIDVHANKIGS